MAKKMLIDATHAEETRVVVVDGNKVEEFDFESQNRRQLAGNIYLAKVTRVEPSLQAAFVDYGGNRHGFLAFSEIHPDYYQIPIADREALKAEEKAYGEFLAAETEREEQKPRQNRRRSVKSATNAIVDPIETRDISLTDEIKTVGSESSGERVIAGPDVLDNVSETSITNENDEANHSDKEVDDPDTSAVENETQDIEIKEEVDEATENYGIESVAQEDDSDDLRPVRKPRPRRYKIQEVVKVRQVMLIQVVKEERGNKGAALTTYLSLAGRYCVLMPNTARGGGISRKITNAVDRKKLKEIATTIEVPDGAGLIVRTAGAKRTKLEIKRDYEYLQRMWEQIRELTLKSTAPTAIYEEGDLIKRSIRDLYNRDIDEILVEGAAGFKNAKDTMKMIMPSHAKNVKNYTDAMPLFARFQVEAFMDGMFNPTVQLKSGGYLVIGITEALVAVDVNSGRATKEASIEQTALNTNLEAAEEVARQLRLRDLAGLIVIDFIDMEERRNNAAVERRIKDKLKTDRARIQIGKISGFGLMEMSRQRLRPGMLEASTQPCAHCHGTGLIRSEDSLGLTILRELEEEGVRRRSKEVLIKAPVSISNFLMNQKREHIAQIEQRHGMAVRIETDPTLISPNYILEKFKTATRLVPENTVTVSSIDIALMEEIDEAVQEDVDEVVPISADEDAPKKRRRRRRRRRSGATDDANLEAASEGSTENIDTDNKVAAEEGSSQDTITEEVKPKIVRPRRGNSKPKTDIPKGLEKIHAVAENDIEPIEKIISEVKVTDVEKNQAVSDENVEKPKRVRKPRKTKAEKEAENKVSDQANETSLDNDTKEKIPSPNVKEKSVKTPVAKKATIKKVEADTQLEPETSKSEKTKEAKKRGWWSRT
ncbi:MAG: ribonuclease E/G [Planktomarina sp.]|nr:ribonuclease E/G [Planktomarina sp.]